MTTARINQVPLHYACLGCVNMFSFSSFTVALLYYSVNMLENILLGMRVLPLAAPFDGNLL
jgi:hypothetical protein